eukprot:6188432-Pleurochrysis_carterae.AAC.4
MKSTAYLVVVAGCALLGRAKSSTQKHPYITSRMVAARAGTGLGHLKVAWSLLRDFTVPPALL